MRITVTGASGFIARSLIDHLAGGRHGVEIFAVDLRDPEDPRPDVSYTREIVESDQLFHLAGAGGIAESMADPHRDLAASVGSTLDVLEAARSGMVGRVVLASSIAVYGNVDGKAEETLTMKPGSPYGVGKMAAEHYLRVYVDLFGINASIARIGNVYGPGQRKHVVYDLMRRALDGSSGIEIMGSRDSCRDFIYVDDVARALVSVAEKGNPGDAYNIGSGEAVSIGELAERIADLAGRRREEISSGSDERAGKVASIFPSIEKLRGLGFRPETSLEQGLRNVAEWMRKEQ